MAERWTLPQFEASIVAKLTEQFGLTVSVNDLRQTGLTISRCDGCGAPECHGWAITTDLELLAVRLRQPRRRA